MKEFDMELEPEGQRKKRIRAGLLAAFLSLAIHIVLFLSISNWSFMLPAVLERMDQTPKLPPMKLENIRHEEKPVRPVIRNDRGSGGGAGGDAVSAAVGSSIEKGADTLARAPREVMTEPAQVTGNRMVGETHNVKDPGPTPERSAWQPRQEIVQIEKLVIGDEVNNLPRKSIPKIERVRNASDVVAQADRESIGKGTRGTPEISNGDGLLLEDLLRGARGGGIGGAGGSKIEGGVKVDLPGKGSGVKIFSEDPAKITQLKALERMLVVEVTVFTSLTDWKYGYMKVEIKRAGAEVLPVIPKDILLIQDCSNSIAEQRLHFCREGLIRCLSEIGPADRFNVVMFREKSQGCFPDWAEAKQENIDRARKFISDMRSEGNTDIYTAISEQMNVKRTPGRPVVTLLVTDGVPTAGLVASGDIIGEFSKLNNGAMSVFPVGTLQTANRYLLDLLGYCNRGDSLIVTSGRWDIPDALQKLMREVSRPVLAETEFHFPVDSPSEVYPVLASNLYLDRPLVLFGRYPRGTRNVVFQAVGKAGDTRCDMVFDVNLETNVKKGDRDVMEMWAKQKIYHTIGQNARKPMQSNLDLIHDTAREYGIRVPYKRILNQKQ